MPRTARNPFEKAQATYQQLTAQTPVGRTALMNSLARVEAAGTELVRTGKVGAVIFANAMRSANDEALALSEAGNVKPPLTPAQTDVLSAKNDMLEILIHSAPGDEAAARPSDTAGIPTGDRKGA